MMSDKDLLYLVIPDINDQSSKQGDDLFYQFLIHALYIRLEKEVQAHFLP